MDYVSTRGTAPLQGFEDVLITGLAPDGGLYVPKHWPDVSKADLRALAGLPYAEAARRVIAPFVGDAIDDDTLAAMTRETYAVFDHPDVAPLVEIGEDAWLLELFHGPTLALKIGRAHV